MYIFPQRGDNIKEKKFLAVKDYEKTSTRKNDCPSNIISGISIKGDL